MFKVADTEELMAASGLTFLALDPDGHRLRLYAPKAS